MTDQHMCEAMAEIVQRAEGDQAFLRRTLARRAEATGTPQTETGAAVRECLPPADEMIVDAAAWKARAETAETRIAELETENARIQHNLEQWRGLAHDNAKAADVATARVRELEEGLKPFGMLAELHDKPSIPDTSGVIFPGSKACVVMGDLRRARALLSPPAHQPNQGGDDAS